MYVQEQDGRKKSLKKCGLTSDPQGPGTLPLKGILSGCLGRVKMIIDIIDQMLS